MKENAYKFKHKRAHFNRTYRGTEEVESTHSYLTSPTVQIVKFYRIVSKEWIELKPTVPQN